ncbi:MAG: tRNA epoxyqueuosine(34) reductase QueG [Melioribacter sp.]|uniref:tRNA epoxyqueuosine(34) reductase QueG n=1 Tax=Rosettibacter primus TaxID=3111523 RepID=UPI00247DA96C|nr:tRNA epoxyqueuosine(34) reductase QueG [Melioribacter sp.]
MKLTNQIVIAKAKELGFDLIGFARAEILEKEIKNLKVWLSKGYNATMEYMNKNIEKRYDVKNILPEAKSVISLAINYFVNDNYTNKNGTGKVSRYAWGKDYHLIMWEKLEILEDELKAIEPSFQSKSYVDTGPVMDKVWAVKSGVGWMGKHTNVISKEIGSWFFLATMITNYEFEYNEQIPDHCGSCRACIDACPTGAIINEYVIDSNRCISFLTIENKGEIPEEFKDKFDNWIFGCDICQDVCPWNKKFSKPTSEHEFNSKENKELEIDKILNMTEEEFKERFQSSPISRAKLNGLKRNAKFIVS